MQYPLSNPCVSRPRSRVERDSVQSQTPADVTHGRRQTTPTLECLFKRLPPERDESRPIRQPCLRERTRPMRLRPATVFRPATVVHYQPLRTGAVAPYHRRREELLGDRSSLNYQVFAAFLIIRIISNLVLTIIIIRTLQRPTSK